MTVVAAVVTRIESLAAVVALAGSRISATHIDQDSEMPAVGVYLVGKIWGQHLRGPDNIKTARIQVDSVATTKAEADELAIAVRGDGLGPQATGLLGFKGRLLSPGFEFEAVRFGGERESYEAPPVRQYRVQIDYLIDFQGDS